MAFTGHEICQFWFITGSTVCGCVGECVGTDRVWRVKKGAGNGEDYAFLIKLALALGACLCSQQASPTPKSNRATLMMHAHTHIHTHYCCLSLTVCVCVYLAAYYAWISNEVANVTQTHDRPQAPSSTSVAYAPPSSYPPGYPHYGAHFRDLFLYNAQRTRPFCCLQTHTKFTHSHYDMHLIWTRARRRQTQAARENERQRERISWPDEKLKNT